MNLETHQTCFHQWKKTCVFLKFETPRFVFDVTHRTLPWQHHLFRLAKKEAENAAKAKSWNVSTWWFNLMLARRKIQLGCRTKKVVMDGNCFRILIKSLINFISSIQISSTQLLRILRICHVFQKPQRSNQKEKQYKLKELCLWSPCFFSQFEVDFFQTTATDVFENYVAPFRNHCWKVNMGKPFSWNKHASDWGA